MKINFVLTLKSGEERTVPCDVPQVPRVGEYVRLAGVRYTVESVHWYPLSGTEVVAALWLLEQ